MLDLSSTPPLTSPPSLFSHDTLGGRSVLLETLVGPQRTAYLNLIVSTYLKPAACQPSQRPRMISTHDLEQLRVFLCGTSQGDLLYSLMVHAALLSSPH